MSRAITLAGGLAAIAAVLTALPSAPARAEAPAPVAAAYARYLQAIDKARGIVDGSAGVRKGHEAEDRREGNLFVQGIVNASLTWALSNTPEAPLMALVPHPSDRLGLNNPDNLYYTARVDDRHSYVISGKRGLARTFAIQANTGLPGLSADKGATVSHVNGSDLQTAKDGSFAITLSPVQPANGNWLPLKPGVDNLLVRFSFLDWKREQRQPGSIAIAVKDAPRSAPVAVTPAMAARMLDEAATAIEEQAGFYTQSYEAAIAHGANRLVGPRRADASQATASHQWSFIGTFEIAADEALIIKVKDAPQARYYNLEAANPWLNTFEFVHHQSSLNRSQLRVDDDGYIRFVVSPVDPGVPNWIDTVGGTHGWIWSRWQEVDGAIGPEFTPEVTIAKRTALRSVLPADTPVVSPAQRKAALRERTAQLQQRFAHADPHLPERVRRLRAIEALLGHRLAASTIDTIVD
jgi:hypothetical protein